MGKWYHYLISQSHLHAEMRYDLISHLISQGCKMSKWYHHLIPQSHFHLEMR